MNAEELDITSWTRPASGSKLWYRTVWAAALLPYIFDSGLELPLMFVAFAYLNSKGTVSTVTEDRLLLLNTSLPSSTTASHLAVTQYLTLRLALQVSDLTLHAVSLFCTAGYGAAKPLPQRNRQFRSSHPNDTLWPRPAQQWRTQCSLISITGNNHLL